MILIEHSGTPDHNELAKQIADIIDDEYGVPYDYLISPEAPVALYETDDYRKIITFNRIPDPDTIRYYLNIALS